MPILTKTTAKTFFETGDRPSETDFSTTIDSVVFQPSVGGALTTGFVEIITTAAATAWSSAGAIPLTVAASGAVPRTLGARFGDILSVKEFNADIGDGATDATVAFDNAETERAALSYQKTFVPDGTYPVTAAPNWANITGPGIIELNGDSIPAGDIVTNVTLNVPGTFPTLATARSYLQARTIRSGAFAIVQVADGTYTFSDKFVFNHPEGARIQLLGNTTTPANCILRFSHAGAQDCLVIDTGHTLGFLDGFQIDLTAKALWPNNGSGLLVDTNGTVICGNNMLVDNVYYGMHARYGGHIRCNRAVVDHAGDVGIFAFLGGTISAVSAKSDNAIDATNSLGSGFVSEYGGAMNAAGAEASGNSLRQFGMFNDAALRTDTNSKNVDDRVTSTDNFLTMRSSAAVVDIFIAGKGAGSFVKVGSDFTASAAAAITGFLRFKDSSDVERKVAVVS